MPLPPKKAPPPTKTPAGDKARKATDALVAKRKAKIKRLAPTKADLAKYLQLAIAFFKENDMEGAEAAAEVAVSCDPESVQAWSMLGATRGRRKQYKEAAEAYQHVIVLSPEDIEAWAALGELYIGLTRYKEAAVALGRACQLDPKGEHPAGRRARAVMGRTIASLRR